MRGRSAALLGLVVVMLVGACGATPSGTGSPATSAPVPGTASGTVPSAPGTASASAASSAAPSPSPAPLVTPRTSDLFTCLSQLQPDPSPSPGAPIEGQQAVDMGAGHVLPGTAVTYASCPPATGKHYNSAGLGPIAPRFYGPDDDVIPQGWLHNLEHGGFVVLYNCVLGACDTATLSQLRTLAATFPASPRCQIPGGALSPVIARFDQMQAPFAALVWDRVYFQQTLDTADILAFWANVGETTNPEKFCP